MVSRTGSRDHGCRERGGPRVRRQFLGRARDRQAEAVYDARLAGRGGAGVNATNQGGDRSGGNYESGEGVAVRRGWRWQGPVGRAGVILTKRAFAQIMPIKAVDIGASRGLVLS